VQGFTRRRFLDLGLTPGTTIYPELGNFFNDPRAYRIRGTLIALRKDQAAQIWVKPV
jgi:Fe2+ transport system protein FeoA